MSSHFVGGIYHRRKSFAWESMYFLMSNRFAFIFAGAAPKNLILGIITRVCVCVCVCDFDGIYIPFIVEIS